MSDRYPRMIIRCPDDRQATYRRVATAQGFDSLSAWVKHLCDREVQAHDVPTTPRLGTVRAWLEGPGGRTLLGEVTAHQGDTAKTVAERLAESINHPPKQETE